MRCSALMWSMTGSTAARRFVSRRMEAVTRRTCPDPDPKPVRVVVAAGRHGCGELHAGELLQVGDHGPSVCPTVQRLCMEHELSTLWGRQGDADLAAELVRRSGFPTADALDVRGMERIDLGVALMLILGTHPLRISSSGPKRPSSAASPLAPRCDLLCGQLNGKREVPVLLDLRVYIGAWSAGTSLPSRSPI